MHVRLWAALSAAVLLLLIAFTGVFVWVCLPYILGIAPTNGSGGLSAWHSRVALAVLCLMTGGYGLALARIAFTLFPSPKGQRLGRIDAPMLWSEVDRIAARLGAPRVHQIRVDERMSASICSRRSWLLFSWRHTLVLGLPLLRALPPEEVRSVIAHELAHLLRGDTILLRSVYRAHALWGTLDGLANRNRHGRIERLILRAARRGSVLTRRHNLASERAADRIALRVASPSVVARALVRTFLAERQIEVSLRDLERREQSQGLSAPTDRMARIERVLTEVDPRAAAWLAEELCDVTWPSSSHPCLRQRVRSITGDVDVAVPNPISASESAASAWLGTLRHEVARALSQADKSLRERLWKAESEVLRTWHQRIDALRARMDELGPEELREFALRLEFVGRPEAAREPLERLVRACPEDADALCHLARVLFEHGQDHDEYHARGLLHRAVEIAPEHAGLCEMTLGRWHARAGRVEVARTCFRRAIGAWRRVHRQRQLEREALASAG